MISRNKNTLSTGVWLLKALCVIKLFINLTNKLIREKDCHVLAIQHEFSFKFLIQNSHSLPQRGLSIHQSEVTSL